MADRAPFSTTLVTATGSTTGRTMPDRLAEVKNVRDFGAKGDGSTDDAAAIRSAINWTSGANRGTIFFPIGVYKVLSSLPFNYAGALSIRFIGEGFGTEILANPGINGYIFDRALGSPVNYDTKIIFERLKIRNLHASGGGIRIGSSKGSAIRDCDIEAHIGVTTEDSVGVSSERLLISDCAFRQQGTVAGSVGIIIGGGGALECNDLRGIDTGAICYGSGLSVNSGKAERNNTAYKLGVDSLLNNVGLQGSTIKAHTFEGNGTAIDALGTISGCSVEAIAIIGHPAPNGDQGTANASQYGIRLRANKHLACFLNAPNFAQVFSGAALLVEDSTNRTFTTIMGGGTAGIFSGTHFSVGTKAHNACYINNDTAVPPWTYAGLPSGAGNVFEGDKFDISDWTGAATFGTVVNAGGGTTRVSVRWNGTAWTVCGA